ncbi:MAG: hypothetical protein C4576_09405 [Desulfobacteraceae bacterium]|nr:MAG: hypothetical protein C4576_09405 [Desulfobacteraceae bacterium]
MEDLFTKTELDNLLIEQGNNCLSIFMPAFQAGQEVRQNPTRFKNLLASAERLLSRNQGPNSLPKDFFEPLRALWHDALYWTNQSSGLAVFRSAGTIRTYRLPVPFRELVISADHFHVKPLVSFLRQVKKYFVLALSMKKVRLMECSRQQVFEVDVPALPASMEEALRYDDPQSRLQFRTGTDRIGDKPSAAVFHSHGTGLEETKNDILRYFKIVNKALENVLQKERDPLVLAGVDYLLPIYEEANTYPHLIKEGITGNPEGWTPEELKKEAWPIIEGLLKEREANAISDYEEKAHRVPGSREIRQIVGSAYHARVDSLLLAEDEEVWGFFDREKDEATISGAAGKGSYDLLNFAAIHTLTNGGTVIPLPRARIPARSQAAALFRY